MSAQERWSGSYAFVLAAVASAVGLGNIWKFPYITGENGGGAFVLVYLACILLIGVPVMIGEVLIGRRSGRSPISAFSQLAREATSRLPWGVAGAIAVIAGTLVMSFYAVVAGWMFEYLLVALSGGFAGTAADAQTDWNQFMASPWRLLLWDSLVIFLTGAIVYLGVRRGIERAVTILMPFLVLVLLIIIGYAIATADVTSALKFLFAPNFSALSTESVIVALGHAFFTLSLGAGIMIIYGAYLPSDVSVTKATLWVATADTIVALMAGIAIFSIVFHAGLDAGGGPGLIFQALPIALGQMPGGHVVGALFFGMVALAALGSTISLVELLVAFCIENFGLSRRRSTFFMSLLCWLLSLGTLVSFNIGAEWKFLGRNIFGWVDHIASNILLPIGGLLVCIFCGWVMTKSMSSDQLDTTPHGVWYKSWLWSMRVVAPVLILAVFAYNLDLIPGLGKS